MRPLSEIRNYIGNYHVKSAVYHYYRNEFSQALGFLRKALADEATLSEGDRRNARCYLALSLKGQGERLAAKGELEMGLEELQRAAEVNPSFPDIHLLRARLLERLERRGEAIRAYRQAIGCHPGYIEAKVALGYCLLSARKTKDAAEAFKQALAMKLQGIEGPFGKGMKQLEAGRPEQALEFFHNVFLAVPRLSDEYLKKALELLRSEDYEKALEELDRAVALNPRYPDLHNFRGIVLCELDRPTDAVEAFRRSAKLSPGQMVPRLNLAFARLRAGQAREAEKELESILRKQPTEPVALAKLEELRSARLGSVRPGSG